MAEPSTPRKVPPKTELDVVKLSSVHVPKLFCYSHKVVEQ